MSPPRNPTQIMARLIKCPPPPNPPQIQLISHSNPLKPKPHSNMSPLEIPFKSIARRLINSPPPPNPIQIPFKHKPHKMPPPKS